MNQVVVTKYIHVSRVMNVSYHTFMYLAFFKPTVWLVASLFLDIQVVTYLKAMLIFFNDICSTLTCACMYVGM